jgi:hypothetical protein
MRRGKLLARSTPHTETPTAACAAVGVSSQSSIGFRRINPSDPGDRSAAPIARPLFDRALDLRNLRAGCRWLGPRHCCHRPLTVTSGVATVIRDRSPGVVGQPLPASPTSAWRPDCSGCLSACAVPGALVRTPYTECVWMSIRSSEEFSGRRNLGRPDAAVGVTQRKFGPQVGVDCRPCRRGHEPCERLRARQRAGAMREVGCRDPSH